MSISLKVKGADRVMRKLERYPSAVDNELDYTLVGFGNALRDSCVRHASGRPGPNVVTGEYVGNMVLEFRGWRGRTVVVYNNSPQARRLEYGFYGTDSLGRIYHQPPFPHMRPALIETFEMYRIQFRSLPMRVWAKL